MALKADVIGAKISCLQPRLCIFQSGNVTGWTEKGLSPHFIPKAVSEVPVSLYSKLKEAVTGVLDSRGFRGGQSREEV